MTLIDKAKSTSSKTWKWILGVLIALMSIGMGLYLKYLSVKLRQLEAEKRLRDEAIKDIKEKAKLQDNEELAQKFLKLAEELENRNKEIEKKLSEKQKVIDDFKKKVDEAKTWKDLENAANS